MKKKLLITSFLAFVLSFTTTIPSPTIEAMAVIDEDNDYTDIDSDSTRPKNITYNIVSLK